MRPGFGQFKFPSSEYLRFAAQYGVKDILLNTPVLEQSRPVVWSKKELIKLRLNIESYGLQLSAIENVPTHFYDHIMLGGEKSELIEGFRSSKTKRNFDAYLQLNAKGKMSFSFPPRKPRAKKG